MLFDADILIWALRGNLKADKVISSTSERFTSVVNYMEVIRGIRNKAELRSVRAFLRKTGFVVLPLSEAIGHRATFYIEEHSLSVKLSVEDALVAATAVEHQLPLCSANDKHFRQLPELELKVFRP